MKNELHSVQGKAGVPNEPLKYSLTQESRLRRLLEMQRRIRGLQVKRNHLRSELQAVEKCLSSLDSQLQSYETYDQLTFNK